MKKTFRATGVLGAILQFNQDAQAGTGAAQAAEDAPTRSRFSGVPITCSARDWPELRPLDVGPDVLICGDLHLENFGATEPRREISVTTSTTSTSRSSLRAASTSSAARPASSLASEQWKLTPSQATSMALAYLENYRAAVLKAVTSGSIHEIIPRGGHGPIQEILGDTAIATQAELLKAKIRRKSDGRLLIRRNDMETDISQQRFDEIAAALESHGQSLGTSETFKVHDLAFRIAGVGSLGVRRYLALVEGAGPPVGYQLLDIKEAGPSAVAPCATDTLPGCESDESRRVVLSQKILQGHVAAGLDELKIGQRSYRMRRDDSRRKPL